MKRSIWRRRTESRVLCIRLDEVAEITDMLQHDRKDSGLLRLAFDRFQNVFLVGEIKPIMHGYKQRPDVLVILKLF
jgi:hypothetical protein